MTGTPQPPAFTAGLKPCGYVVGCGFLAGLVTLASGYAQARFVPSRDGLTVADTELHVTWTADLNLPASQKFGLPVHDSGSMTYPTARRWVAALNASGYAGRKDWTMAAMP